jgi:transcriptional regulator with PAS, ATPase and Fis domain
MTYQRLWALDSEFTRSVLGTRFDATFLSLPTLLGKSDFADDSLVILEPRPEVIQWLGKLGSGPLGPAIYLLCPENPGGSQIDHFFSLGVKGCFTADEGAELFEILQEALGTVGDTGPQLLQSADWINQLRQLDFITQDQRMRELFESIRKVARTDATVLITGENGTGKEVVARMIHALSPRGKNNFMAVHTGAIPENLLESELFGHVRGAFTSAIKDRKGKFEAGNGGTIFLDEVSTMPASLQVKLLRVLQQKQFERVGDNQLIRADVRIVSATNADLFDMVHAGQFREDLYYRLNVVPVHIPPLRSRPGDVSVLATHFIQGVCKKYEIPLKKISLGALRLLMHYSWPGNVRQLENIVERMVVLNPDVTVFMPRHVPEEVLQVRHEAVERPSPLDTDLLSSQGLSLPEMIRNIEKKLILESLQKTQWNKQQAAKILKINRTTLIEKMKRLEEQHEEE